MKSFVQNRFIWLASVVGSLLEDARVTSGSKPPRVIRALGLICLAEHLPKVVLNLEGATSGLVVAVQTALNDTADKGLADRVLEKTGGLERPSVGVGKQAVGAGLLRVADADGIERHGTRRVVPLLVVCCPCQWCGPHGSTVFLWTVARLTGCPVAVINSPSSPALPSPLYAVAINPHPPNALVFSQTRQKLIFSERPGSGHLGPHLPAG